MNRLLFRITPLLLVAMIAGCEPRQPAEDPAAIPEEPEIENEVAPDTLTIEDPDAQVEIDDFEYRLNGLERVVSGVLYNPSDRRIRHAEVRVGFYDADNQLGETIAIAVTDIAPGERRTFRREVDTEVDYPRARVRDVMVVR